MTAMKKITALALAGLMLLLSGCGAKAGPESGFQPDFTVSNFIYGSMVATEDGYFVELFNRVYYVEAETMDYILFCADPSCDHHKYNGEADNLDCLARYVGGGLGAIQYYDGELYFTRYDDGSSGYMVDTIMAVKSDTTGLRDVQERFNQKTDRWPANIGGSHFDYAYAILGDAIMFCPRAFMVKVGKLGDSIENAKELFTYDKLEPRFNGTELHWDIWVDGGYFYYCGVNYPDGVIKGQPSQLLYRYDLATEENALIWRSDEQAGAASVDGWYLRDGVFYYYINEQPYGNAESGLYRCDLETMETVKLSNCSGFGGNSAAEFDSEYAYIMEYDFNAITVLSLTDGRETVRLDLNAAAFSDGVTIKPDYGSFFRAFCVAGADETWLFVILKGYDSDDGFHYMLYGIEKEHFAKNEWRLIIDSA